MRTSRAHAPKGVSTLCGAGTTSHCLVTVGALTGRRELGEASWAQWGRARCLCHLASPSLCLSYGQCGFAAISRKIGCVLPVIQQPVLGCVKLNVLTWFIDGRLRRTGVSGA